MRTLSRLALLCALLLTAAAFLFCATAENQYTCGDYNYKLLEDDTAEIIRYTGTEGDVSVPSKLDGHPVTSIGVYAFHDSLVKNVTIPDGVTVIRYGAFDLCKSLTTITIPDSVMRIEDSAFGFSPFLTDIVIPDSVTYMGTNPFIGCSALTRIIVSPDHPIFETIDGVLFDKAEEKLICYPCAFTQEQYVVPNGITSIGAEAFYSCRFLTSIVIPDSVTNIGDGAFISCHSLASINIPDGVASIGNDTFSHCISLSSIDIPSSVTSIGERTFLNCIALISATIPDSVTSIGAQAFENCSEDLAITVTWDWWEKSWRLQNDLH